MIKRCVGLKKALLLRVAKNRGEPLPPTDLELEGHHNSVDLDEELVQLDHDYFGVAEEVTVCDDDGGSIDNDKAYDWRVGRRIVELNVLADGLRACQLCQSPLQLHNCVNEKKFGISQILQIKCEHCHLLNDVATGRRGASASGYSVEFGGPGMGCQYYNWQQVRLP
ncbi:uncharacterized protein LOC134276103 [Saccostrea cucullata]|uniref:uncharacterized protein LOC134276103 n=1 Tax=Saccostrea cuccullata TaxID=36930 RepID=UPI002ED6B274